MKKEWSKISLIFLFLVALVGTLLRSVAFIELPFEYLNLVHAHSHVAFQGWVYTIMILLLTSTFLREDQIKKGRYPLQFVLTVFVVVGVLISFSLQGYALYSIIFSTLFQLLNYWFIYRFLKDSRDLHRSFSHAISIRFVRTGLWLGLLSTIMPLGIGILSAKGLSGTEAYQSLVYTFLHLQYNGWFLFVVLGLFFHLLDKSGIRYQKKFANLFYWLLTIAVVPSIALSLLGMEFSTYIIAPAYISSALTGGALLFFLIALPRGLIASLKEMGNWFRLFLLAFLASFILKMILQSLSVFPIFKPYAFFNKPIIIAYLHLSLIGSISFLFFALMLENKWLPLNRRLKIGSALFISGFVATELLLTFQGLGIYFSQIPLIMGSTAMALGVLLMIINGVQNKA